MQVEMEGVLEVWVIVQVWQFGGHCRQLLV